MAQLTPISLGENHGPLKTSTTFGGWAIYSHYGVIHYIDHFQAKICGSMPSFFVCLFVADVGMLGGSRLTGTGHNVFVTNQLLIFFSGDGCSSHNKMEIRTLSVTPASYLKEHEESLLPYNIYQ